MKTAVGFVQKNLIDLSKESFTQSKMINQTGKELYTQYYRLFCVFLLSGQSFFFTVCFGLSAHKLQKLQISSMFYVHCR